jgi:hypothetical protein
MRLGKNFFTGSLLWIALGLTSLVYGDVKVPVLMSHSQKASVIVYPIQNARRQDSKGYWTDRMSLVVTSSGNVSLDHSDQAIQSPTTYVPIGIRLTLDADTTVSGTKHKGILTLAGVTDPIGAGATASCAWNGTNYSYSVSHTCPLCRTHDVLNGKIDGSGFASDTLSGNGVNTYATGTGTHTIELLAYKSKYSFPVGAVDYTISMPASTFTLAATCP